MVFEPPPTGAAIGAAVAATGNVAIVGAPGRTHTGLAEAGCAYVIDIDRARTRRVLVAPDAREYARLGGAVAITSEEGAGDDRYVLIGAPTDPIRPGESHGYGSVYVYAWRQAAGSDVFSLHAKLTPAVTSWSILRDGHFGCSIAVHAQRAAIGARGPNEYPAGEATPAHNGFVYLFDLPSGRQLARLSPLEVHTHEPLSRCFWFGASVALTEHLVVVGAPKARAPCSHAALSGAVFLFEHERSWPRARASEVMLGLQTLNWSTPFTPAARLLPPTSERSEFGAAVQVLRGDRKSVV